MNYIDLDTFFLVSLVVTIIMLLVTINYYYQPVHRLINAIRKLNCRFYYVDTGNYKGYYFQPVFSWLNIFKKELYGFLYSYLQQDKTLYLKTENQQIIKVTVIKDHLTIRKIPNDVKFNLDYNRDKSFIEIIPDNANIPKDLKLIIQENFEDDTSKDLEDSNQLEKVEFGSIDL